MRKCRLIGIANLYVNADTTYLPLMHLTGVAITAFRSLQNCKKGSKIRNMETTVKNENPRSVEILGFGATPGNRTPNLCITNALLYR